MILSTNEDRLLGRIDSNRRTARPRCRCRCPIILLAGDEPRKQCIRCIELARERKFPRLRLVAA